MLGAIPTMFLSHTFLFSLPHGSDESVSETTVLLPRSPKQQPGSASPRSGGDSTRARTRMGSPFPSSLDSADGGTQGGRDGDATEDLYDSPGDVV